MPTESSRPVSIHIQPLTPSDITTCAALTAHTFHFDRHTRVKQLGKDAFDLELMFADMLTAGLRNGKHVYVKAVDEQTDEVLGWCGWGSRGVDAKELREAAGLERMVVGDEDEVKKKGEQESGKAEEKAEEIKQNENEEKEEDDPISRLHALESADMNQWMSRLMPASLPTRCMFVISLLVSHNYKHRGAGTTLVKFGTELADKLGVFTWVHASEEAYGLLPKFGFEQVGELVVDLDEYAPRGPSEEEESELGLGGGRWGIYRLRYVKRLPKGTSS